MEPITPSARALERSVRPAWARSAAFGVIVLFAVIWVRTAWISDDATITLRSVLNLLAGGGPNFNWGERVDAFTDPAWFLLISAFSFTGANVFWVTLGLSFALSIGTLAVIWHFCSTSYVSGIIALGALVASKSFVDFSSSGLENPLGAFLLVVIVACSMHIRAVQRASRAQWILSVSTGLLFLTRVDLLITALPLSVLLALQLRHTLRRAALLVIAGIAMPVSWTAFSLVYYGFAVPNTAYAKLGSGLGESALILQGFKYLLDSVARDPITLVLIAVSAIAVVSVGGAVARLLMIGLLLYLAYVVWIGGDFMSGRFLMVPAVGAAAALATVQLPLARAAVTAAVLGVLGVVGLPNTLFSDQGFSNSTIASSGIADERGFWFQHLGLVSDGTVGYDYARWAAPSTFVVDAGCGGLGEAGLRGGPGLHLIDTCGLADPLLARIPAMSTPTWRIGHFVRYLPLDYRFSVEHGTNAIRDRQLHRYYDALMLITRSPDLLAPARLRAIWDVNAGASTPGRSFESEAVAHG